MFASKPSYRDRNAMQHRQLEAGVRIARPSQFVPVDWWCWSSSSGAASLSSRFVVCSLLTVYSVTAWSTANRRTAALFSVGWRSNDTGNRIQLRTQWMLRCFAQFALWRCFCHRLTRNVMPQLRLHLIYFLPWRRCSVWARVVLMVKKDTGKTVRLCFGILCDSLWTLIAHQ